MATNNKFQQTAEQWRELNMKLYDECIEFLMETLKNYPDNLFDFSEDDMICVNYDGGKHPEYASNCFSLVQTVYLKDGKLYVDLEDDCEYPIDRLCAAELYEIANVVDVVING